MVVGATSITACNTMRGVGEDVEAAGETVSEAADEAEDDLTDGE
ncbi:MAG: entericidin A/B family lipoprotein [Alphaproteobacteria bacterium]|nr:entericidin A/B family lipoprotein [Alphaproteobacteria bacterium]